MDFSQIEERECPICKAKIQKNEIFNQHLNELWNEVRDFTCGHRISFNPNFKSKQVERMCSNSPIVKDINMKRAEALKKLKSYTLKLNVDEQFKKQIIDFLERSF